MPSFHIYILAIGSALTNMYVTKAVVPLVCMCSCPLHCHCLCNVIVECLLRFTTSRIQNPKTFCNIHCIIYLVCEG